MLLLFFLGCSLLILEMTAFQALPLWEIRIDGLILLIMYVSFYLDGFGSLLLIFALGILMDIFSGSVLGIHTFIYIILFVLIKLISRNLIIKNTLHQIFLVLLLGAFANLCVLVFNYLFTGTTILWKHLVVLVSQSVLTASLYPVFFKAFDHIDKTFGLRELHEI